MEKSDGHEREGVSRGGQKRGRQVGSCKAAACLALVIVAFSTPPALLAETPVQAAADGSGFRPIEEFSPAFLGIYRKVMEIEDEISGHAETYGVDIDLAWAVCLYESGGNANLNSWAGARCFRHQVLLRSDRHGVKPIPSWNSPRLLMAYAAFFFDVVVSIFSSRFIASRSLGRCR